MGNWRTVHIVGTCDNKDLNALSDALNPGKNYENFHCLVNGGICGLPNWAMEQIDVVGNLAERNYDWDDVAKQLEELIKIAPSLAVDIHCGDDYESSVCKKTVRLSRGKVKILEPLKSYIPDIDTGQMQANFLQQMMR